MTKRRSKTQVLAHWPVPEVEMLRSDLKADPSLGGAMSPVVGYQWLAAAVAVLALTGAELTEPLF